MGQNYAFSMLTRSSSACHVGPLALKRLINFASIILVYPFKHIWTHLKQFWTNLNPFDNIWTSFEHVWTCLNIFEHIWTYLNIFEQVLNKFEHVLTHVNKFEHIWTDFEQVLNPFEHIPPPTTHRKGGFWLLSAFFLLQGADNEGGFWLISVVFLLQGLGD